MTAIFYHPEAYSMKGAKLMGRNAAGDSFLRGFMRYSERSDVLYAQVSNQAHADQFSEITRKYNRREQIKVFSRNQLHIAKDAGNIYFPGPGLREFAYHRSLFGNESWSLCGITHTTSSAGAMDAISSWIASPVQPWDAVICTSTAVKKNVEVVLEAEIDALKERLGISKIVLPQLPVIPLGIHSSDFAYSDEERSNARDRLNAAKDSIIVLYVGRLSFHAKAHPLAMYQALENAARIADKEVVLVECGWFANEHIEEAFSAAAHLVSPSVRVISLDGRVEENRKLAWSCADIFCSLSDNIQETFGIVPIEAMAAGLPVVVSDWDGYKDTVRDGVDGFRIPTIAPAPGLAGDLATRHALETDTYDMYCGHSSSLVGLDARKLTSAFSELFSSPDLRSRMGESGRLRANQVYDWRVIIKRYEKLWQEQTKIRIEAQNSKAADGRAPNNTVRPRGWPARLDPTIGFANYPTQHLNSTTQLTMTCSTASETVQKLHQYKELLMVNFAHYVFPTDEEIQSVLEIAEKSYPNSCSADELIAGASSQRRPYVLRGLAWLCKLGLLQF